MGTMKFSVVMPIHNEEKLLLYSLPSILKLKPDEIILIFDRCTDRSNDVAKKIAKMFGYFKRTKFIELNAPSPEWKFRVAFLRRYGFKIAKNDIIFNTDADTILDEKIGPYLSLINKDSIALISFYRKTYPPTFQSFIAKLITTLIPKIGFTGIYAFYKKAWQETENQNSVRKILRGEDTHLFLSVSKKYRTKFIKTNTIHLRPEEKASRHYIKGIINWNIRRYPLWKAIFHSIIYLRPLFLAGYLYSRLKSQKSTKPSKIKYHLKNYD